MPKKKKEPEELNSRWGNSTPVWNKTFVPFGDRLNFLSPEGQHLATGRLRILAPLNRKPRERDAA